MPKTSRMAIYASAKKKERGKCSPRGGQGRKQSRIKFMYDNLHVQMITQKNYNKEKYIGSMLVQLRSTEINGHDE